MLRRKSAVFSRHSLYLNVLATNLASDLGPNPSNHSYGYAFHDFAQAPLPYSPQEHTPHEISGLEWIIENILETI